MDFDKKLIGRSIALMVFVFLSGYFFSLTKITLNSFMSINISPVVMSIFSINGICFIATLSISLALIMIIKRGTEQKTALLYSIPPFVVAAICAVIVFGLWDFIIPLLFALLGMLLVVNTLERKEAELKYVKVFRAATWCGGKIILLASIGFLISLIIYAQPHQKELSDNFTKEFLAMSTGNNISLDETLQSKLADAMLNNQEAVVDQVLATTEMNALLAKGDSDAAKLSQKLVNMKETINNPQTKKNILGEMQKNNINVGEDILTQMPFLEQFSSGAYMLYAVSAYVLALLFGSIFIGNISAAIYWIIAVLLPKSPTSTEQKQNP